MKKVTRKLNTPTASSKETNQKEVPQTQYSQKIKDFIGKTIGFKTITVGLINLVIVAAMVVRIGFAIYTQNPYLLAPEAIPSKVIPEAIPTQATPEEPQHVPNIHFTA